MNQLFEQMIVNPASRRCGKRAHHIVDAIARLAFALPHMMQLRIEAKAPGILAMRAVTARRAPAYCADRARCDHIGHRLDGPLCARQFEGTSRSRTGVNNSR